MASYQEIETKLAQLTRMVEFAMKAVRMRAAVGTGVLGPDGKPSVKVAEGSLLDFYRLSEARDITLQSDNPSFGAELVKAVEAEAASEIVNG